MVQPSFFLSLVEAVEEPRSHFSFHEYDWNSLEIILAYFVHQFTATVSHSHFCRQVVICVVGPNIFLQRHWMLMNLYEEAKRMDTFSSSVTCPVSGCEGIRESSERSREAWKRIFLCTLDSLKIASTCASTANHKNAIQLCIAFRSFAPQHFALSCNRWFNLMCGWRLPNYMCWQLERRAMINWPVILFRFLVS